jgi:hypothetical protein
MIRRFLVEFDASRNLLLQVSTTVRALLGLLEDSSNRQLALNVEALHRVRVDEPHQTASNGSFSSLVPSPQLSKRPNPPYGPPPLWSVHAMP